MEIDVQERVSKAQDYFKQGYNCAQAVALAFQDVLNADTQTIEKLTIGLGGGVGRMREVCGTVSAMAVVAGSIAPMEGKPVHEQKSAAYAVVQELAGKFKEENGSIVCRDLMGIRADAKITHEPQERNDSYYKARPCIELVGCSARIIAEYISTLI